MNRDEKLRLHFLEKLDRFRDLLEIEFKNIIDGGSSMYFGRIWELGKFGIRTGNKYVDENSIHLEEMESELDRLGGKLGDDSYKYIEGIVEEYVDKVYRAGHFHKSYRIYLAKESLNRLRSRT